MSGRRDGLSGEQTPQARRELLARLLQARSNRDRLSFAQERIWLLHQMAPDSPVYNIPAAVRLTGALDEAALERSLGEIVSRHEVLRTRFEHQEQGLVPLVEDAFELPFTVEDLSGEPLPNRESLALSKANQEARRPFDLEHAPLMRVLLLRLGDEDHLLVLTLHHIAAEGWSVAVLFGELEQLYAAHRRGETPTLDPLPLQYGDYARWQRKRSSDNALAVEQDYWQRQLAGELPVLELQGDRPRPPVPSFQGEWTSRRLSENLVAATREFSRSRGATSFMVLLAAFQALLQRYTGETDIIVGSPIAGRNHAEAERLVGLFVNTLALRTDLSGDPTFDALVERSRQTVVGAFSHQEIPFERVVEAIQPERQLSHSPIFQVLFALQNTPPPALTLAGPVSGCVLDPCRVHNGTTKVDLALFAEASGDSLVVGCEYSSDLFDAESIERLLAQFEVLLAAAVANPSERLSRLPLLTHAERDRQLIEWNDTLAPFPQRSVQELFEQQAKERPDAIAVVFGDTQLTYRELDRRAGRLARQLRELDIEPGEILGICMNRSAEMYVAMVAILKTGCAYMPLDASNPFERIDFMIRDTGARFVVTDSSTHALVERTHALPVVPDTAGMTLGEGPQSDDRSYRSAPGDLAYLVYTSGSTGRPKAVAVPHRGIVRLVREADYLQLAANDCIGQTSNAAFDAATFEVWGALLNGATLVGLDKNVLLSRGELTRAIEEHGIRHLFLTTALFHAIAHEEPGFSSTLDTLLVGGEALDPDTVANVWQHGPPRRLLNCYGPSENTTFSTWHRADPAVDGTSTVPIGRPVPNTAAFVLDGNMEPTPIGVTGELYVGGAGLAMGYWNRCSLTAERFVPNPFGPSPGSRLYRTGDVVRQRADGVLEFLRRGDGQVKVRGFRIEPREIELTLAAHSAVRESVVLAHPGDETGLRLVAYVLATDPQLTAASLRAHLKDRLPDYMIPADFLVLNKLPLTPGGKIDRAALPDPSDYREGGGISSRPGTETEEIVADIWREALGVESLGTDDNFFEVGGHSLLLIMIHAKLRERFEQDITVVDLFRYPTIQTLAACLESRLPAPQVT